MQRDVELQARRRQQLHALALLAVVACKSDAPAKAAPQTIRVAVIGGMMETGFWPELVARYEHLTGNKVELAASGPKPIVVDAFRKGGIDLITFHSSDAFSNLVADGLAVDPQPWVRNDLVIVGPKADPAAVKKIIDAKQKLVVHASMGADGVLHDLQQAGNVVMPADQLINFDGENQHAASS